ncbi:DDE-type integrase/transposase/recombinase [Roseibium sp. M-1]
MDWFTRKVLAWCISSTLDADFCVEALNEAIHKFGVLEIMSTDQGSQFTSFAWTDQLRRMGVRISPLVHVNMHCRAMDGRQGTVPRQYLRRAAVAHAQIRVCLSARLGYRLTDQGRCPIMDGFL